MKEKKQPDPTTHVYNPDTKRWVKKDGALGKKLVAKQLKTSPQIEQKKIPSTTPPKSVFKFKKMPIKLRVTQKDPNAKEEQPKRVANPAITLQQFEKLLETPAFITKFRIAVLNLLKYKVELYKNREMLPKVGERVVKDQANADDYGAITMEINKLIPVLSTSAGDALIKRNLLLAVNNKKLGMKSLIGREKIMDKLAGLLYAFSNNYKIFTRVFMNFSIFGSAGVGKTALAKVLAYVFKNSFLLVRGKIIMATRQELVGQFVGQTAVKTRAALFDSLENILFIDEAYSLTPCPGAETAKDFGSEAIAELINFMDKTMGLMVIMVAGYEYQMKVCFFPFNEGLDRRFPNKITLDRYTNEQLTEILIMNLIENDVEVTKDTRDFLYSLIVQFNEISPIILKNQAGDALNFANAITQSIYMAYAFEWNKSKEDNHNIILGAAEEFLSSKGFDMTFV